METISPTQFDRLIKARFEDRLTPYLGGTKPTVWFALCKDAIRSAIPEESHELRRELDDIEQKIDDKSDVESRNQAILHLHPRIRRLLRNAKLIVQFVTDGQVLDDLEARVSHELWRQIGRTWWIRSLIIVLSVGVGFTIGWSLYQVDGLETSLTERMDTVETDFNVRSAELSDRIDGQTEDLEDRIRNANDAFEKRLAEVNTEFQAQLSIVSEASRSARESIDASISRATASMDASIRQVRERSQQSITAIDEQRASIQTMVDQVQEEFRAQLEDKYSVTNQTIGRLAADSVRLQDDFDKTSDQIRQLETDASAAAQDLGKRAAEFDKAYDAATGKLKKFEEVDFPAMSGSIMELEGSIAALDRDRQDLDRRLADLDKQVTGDGGLEQSAANLRTQLSTATGTLVTVAGATVKHLAEQRKQLSDLTAPIAQLKTDLDNTSGRHTDLASRVQELDDAVGTGTTTLSTSMTDFGAAYAAAMMSLTGAETGEMATFRRAHTNAMRSLTDLEIGDIAVLNGRIRAVRLRVDDAAKAGRTLAREVEAASNLATETSTQLTTESGKASTLKGDLDAARAAFDAYNDGQGLSAAVEDLGKRVAALDGRVDSLGDMQEVHADLLTLIGEMSARARARLAEIEDANAAARGLIDEAAELRQGLVDLSVEPASEADASKLQADAPQMELETVLTESGDPPAPQELSPEPNDVEAVAPPEPLPAPN